MASEKRRVEGKKGWGEKIKRRHRTHYILLAWTLLSLSSKHPFWINPDPSLCVHQKGSVCEGKCFSRGEEYGQILGTLLFIITVGVWSSDVPPPVTRCGIRRLKKIDKIMKRMRSVSTHTRMIMCHCFIQMPIGNDATARQGTQLALGFVC